jgi:hypothetical protein
MIPEIDHIRASGGHRRQFRRLLRSLVEIEILQGRQSVTECLIKELLTMYKDLTEHDINDQVWPCESAHC